MIVVVGGVKGGTGKTTLATNLVVMRAKDKKVLLVDADEQRSASTWVQQRIYENIPTSWTTIQLTGVMLRDQIHKMKGDYDDIVIDVGGRETASLRASAVIADIYLVPFQPRSLDIWTIGNVKSIITDGKCYNPDMKAYAVINRADCVGFDNKDAIDILKNCDTLRCLSFVIGQRKAFANASSNGLGVIEMKNPDKKAVKEMTALYNHLYKNDIKMT